MPILSGRVLTGMEGDGGGSSEGERTAAAP